MPTPTPAVVPPPPSPTDSETGEMEFELSRLKKPLRLKQVCRDPTWDRAKLIGFVIGSILFVYVLGNEMYRWGTRQVPAAPAATVQQQVVPPVQQVAPTPQPQWNTYVDCQRYFVLTVRRDPEGMCDSLPH